VKLGDASQRGENLREEESFFHGVSQVRELLHGEAPTGIRGVETR
jgi:NitT/TauT family transport system ATP-binding protein